MTITEPNIGPLGSSPRVRGKPAVGHTQDADTRLIPARAGKTLGALQHGRLRRAHPRACGENEIARAEDVNGNGSSPRVRGKPRPP